MRLHAQPRDQVQNIQGAKGERDVQVHLQHVGELFWQLLFGQSTSGRLLKELLEERIYQLELVPTGDIEVVEYLVEVGWGLVVKLCCLLEILQKVPRGDKFLHDQLLTFISASTTSLCLFTSASSLVAQKKCDSSLLSPVTRCLLR